MISQIMKIHLTRNNYKLAKDKNVPRSNTC
jgi:hypothetical protein